MRWLASCNRAEHGWNALVWKYPRRLVWSGGIKGSSDDKINGALKAELKNNTKFIDELAQFLDTLGQEPDARTEDLKRRRRQDEDDDAEVALTPKTKAIKRYKDALSARARSLGTKRTQDKTSVNAKVLAWISVTGVFRH